MKKNRKKRGRGGDQVNKFKVDELKEEGLCSKSESEMIKEGRKKGRKGKQNIGE